MEFRKSRFSQSSEAKTHELPLVDSRLSEMFTVEDQNLTKPKVSHFRAVWEVKLKAMVLFFSCLQEDLQVCYL